MMTNATAHRAIRLLSSGLPLRLSRRGFLGLLLLSSCQATLPSPQRRSLVVGTVSYEEGRQSLDRYDRFKHYLSEKTQSLVELEPALNEGRALERIQRQEWSLVFAPPGLAAIAIAHHQYRPLFPMIGVQELRSVLVVRDDSPIREIGAIAGKSVALGKPGSATGYYLPIFNLYGLTLAELIFPPTPKAILEAVSQGKAAVGAVSLEEFETYKSQVTPLNLRIVLTDVHTVPTGAVLISPTIESKAQESIRKILSETPSVVAQEAEFVTNAPVADYTYMISVVERVRAIFPGDTRETVTLLQQKPVRLFK